MSKLKCGIIGFGGLGQIHFSNLINNENVELVAICDVNEEKFTKATDTNQGKGKEFDVSSYKLYTDAEKMLNDEKFDLVVVALPTYLHAKYSIMALDKGAHVFCEKPMARTVAECQEMIAAAERNGKQLAIGQCVRFNLRYKILKEACDSGKYGKLLRLELNRYGFPPVWGWENWYMDFEKSGGAALDLHVHDVDFLNYMLGRPNSVQSEAIHKIAGFDCITSRFFYDNDAIIRVTGDWSMPNCYGFKPTLFAQFEKAVLVTGDKGVVVYPEDGEMTEIECDATYSGYDAEMKHFIECIIENKPNLIVPAESTMQSIEMVFAEMKSVETNEKVKL
ncbi:MAG: Gfo/Idh/MocA family oxidoreductase [Ruminococcaceae bacterium]|nr:Gfo/Idh/MocA family oxidoreductase [Oscillospiraceae bacterium]